MNRPRVSPEPGYGAPCPWFTVRLAKDGRWYPAADGCNREVFRGGTETLQDYLVRYAAHIAAHRRQRDEIKRRFAEGDAILRRGQQLRGAR